LRIAIVDYGIGNLHSIRKGLERAGAETEIVSEMSNLSSAECIVFPGVGAFGEAMDRLETVRETIIERLDSGVPAMGICLGMQILFDSSDESSRPGLGFVRGKVKKLIADRIPQMGWNDAVFDEGDPIFNGIRSGTQFYFANSYACYPEDPEYSISMTEYGRSKFPSSLRKNNTFGFQFHPEKSADAGLSILDNFVKIAREIRNDSYSRS